MAASSKIDEGPAYDADALLKLDPIEHIRKRPSMYLGSNSGAGGLTTALREILDNSVDEFLNGHGDRIALTFFADGSAEVADSGRGIPTGINKQTGENGIVLALGSVGAGGKFGTDDSGYGGGSGGLNGVGTTASNAVSRRFDVTVFQGGKEHRISFKEGRPGHFDKPNDPSAKFKPSSDLISSPDKRPAAVKKARPTGTTIRMWPDNDIFAPQEVKLADGSQGWEPASFDVETLKFRLKSTAFLLAGLRIEVNDLRDADNPLEEVYDYDGGISEMLETIATDQPAHKAIYFHTEGSFSETVPKIGADGKTTMTELERKVDIQVAFRFGTGFDTKIKSFVNIINTQHGGTHEDGYYSALSREFRRFIADTPRMLKPKEEQPKMEDVKEALTSIISIKFPEPQFTGQEKSTLGTSAITSVVSQAVGKALREWLADKKNATTAKLIGNKIVEASRIRLREKSRKDTERKRNALEASTSMPEKLVGCNIKDNRYSELQICEGDSALGGLKMSRDSDYQAIYPLKGKPKNTYEASLGSILENQEWSDLIQIIGAGVGREFDLEQMNFRRLIILADGDPDGSHIRALLVVFFWKYMRPLVEDGRLYTALPPLFSITTSGRNPERFYALNQTELDALLPKLAKAGKKYDKIQRHKGLGEYDEEILAERVMDPTTRVLRRITVGDAHEAEAIFNLTMSGSKAAERKEWITNFRDIIDADQIETI